MSDSKSIDDQFSTGRNFPVGQVARLVTEPVVKLVTIFELRGSDGILPMFTHKIAIVRFCGRMRPAVVDLSNNSTVLPISCAEMATLIRNVSPFDGDLLIMYPEILLTFGLDEFTSVLTHPHVLTDLIVGSISQDTYNRIYVAKYGVFTMSLPNEVVESSPIGLPSEMVLDDSLFDGL